MKKKFTLAALLLLSLGWNVQAQYNKLLDFNLTNGGEIHWATCLTVAGPTMYGMTNGGGASFQGLAFSMNTNGTGYKDLLDFNNANGQYPNANLTLSGTVLYGMTPNGGANGGGVIFSAEYRWYGL